jgi:phosphoribulokinase
MAEDVLNLKSGVAVDKPIYNHITGALDPDEHVEPTPIVIFEGLHPLYDDRVREAIDLSIYLDITDSVKFAWKAQRDIAERGATMEEVQEAIDARKPDFTAFVEPQKAQADIIIQVLMSDITDDPSGKYLKVKYIQKKAVTVCESPFLFDKGSCISWTPNTDKLSTTAPGVKFASYDDEWFGQPVSVVEMDGNIDVLEELIYVESAICGAGTKSYGELTEQMVKNKASPGSENGTGLFQTLASFKIREAFESITGA